MSLRTLEKAILEELRTKTKNHKLKLKNIAEWSSAEIKPQPGERYIYLPEIGIHVAYFDTK